MSWGEPGKGKWVTIYTNPGHVFMEVAGVRFDTSNARVTGSRWRNADALHERVRRPPSRRSLGRLGVRTPCERSADRARR